MKHLFRRTIIALIACLCCFSFASCGNGIKGSEAKTTINDFFAAVSVEDYEKAEGLLHPDRPADLKDFFTYAETEKGLDFQKGVEIEQYTGFSTALYDGSVGGSTYELTMQARIGDKQVEFKIELVKNKNGYGIYNFYLDT